MNTLIDFVRFTKGWEYVIAICAIFSFIAFWMLWRSAVKERPAESRKSVQTREAAARSGAFQPRHSAAGMHVRR